MDLNKYNYHLPDRNLALEPVSPRDSSKLFVYNTKTNQTYFDRFIYLDRYLPVNSFLVLNNTKVLPARVEMKKQTGGKIIVVFLVNEVSQPQNIKIMVDRKVNVGDKLFFENNEFLTVLNQKEHIFTVNYSFSKNHLFDLLKKYGNMPIPLYLKKTPLKRDELIEKYQTIFAKYEGSSAAPTASFHFTDRVFDKLKEKGINKYFITLHIGLGTFAPLTEENINKKKLHEEYYEVKEKTINEIKDNKAKGMKLISVGTTVTRTLESVAKTNKLISKTDLFIYPPYNFKMVDILITNFHLPKSSLMMLVEAFLQFKKSKKSLVELYEIAIKNNFRFYSFGDAMLIL